MMAVQFQEGDHIWCHPRRYVKLVQHHGICAIVEGVWGVLHYDGERNDDYYVYQNCHACRARLENRRNRGYGGQHVRFSCFACFSRGERLHLCKYGRSFASVICREWGTRSTQTSRPGHVVADSARALYRDNNFGEYHLFTRNCEDFARFCKTGKVGSKQVARGFVITALTTGSFGFSASLAGFSILRLHQNARLRSRHLR